MLKLWYRDWMIRRLIGHDYRARHEQPVAKAATERFAS
jgi:hypothetical protein